MSQESPKSPRARAQSLISQNKAIQNPAEKKEILTELLLQKAQVLHANSSSLEEAAKKLMTQMKVFSTIFSKYSGKLDNHLDMADKTFYLKEIISRYLSPANASQEEKLRREDYLARFFGLSGDNWRKSPYPLADNKNDKEASKKIKQANLSFDVLLSMSDNELLSRKNAQTTFDGKPLCKDELDEKKNRHPLENTINALVMDATDGKNQQSILCTVLNDLEKENDMETSDWLVRYKILFQIWNNLRGILKATFHDATYHVQSQMQVLKNNLSDNLLVKINNEVEKSNLIMQEKLSHVLNLDEKKSAEIEMSDEISKVKQIKQIHKLIDELALTVEGQIVVDKEFIVEAPVKMENEKQPELYRSAGLKKAAVSIDMRPINVESIRELLTSLEAYLKSENKNLWEKFKFGGLQQTEIGAYIKEMRAFCNELEQAVKDFKIALGDYQPIEVAVKESLNNQIGAILSPSIDRNAKQSTKNRNRSTSMGNFFDKVKKDMGITTNSKNELPFGFEPPQ